jgi:hypothetical protein
MEFHDFQIRAWTVDKKHAAVLVHSSPAGAMQQPEKVVLDWVKLNALSKIFQLASGQAKEEMIAPQLTEGGRELAGMIFPDSILGLFIRSLAQLDPEDGLRVRLCLDRALSDLPWEYLVLPDATGLKSPGGFLVLDDRVSLVREPPKPGQKKLTLRKKQRLLFFGTRLCAASGDDLWKTAEERDSLFKALEPASAHLVTRAVLSDETDCQTALRLSGFPIDIFHYSGHTDVENSVGYLVAKDVDLGSQNVEKLYANTLGRLLRGAGTTLAVFSACNSGRWVFVEPLLQAGVPVVIGAQGLVYVPVAIAFCQRLYSALAIGLSLDESVTWARLHLLEPGVLPESVKWQWGAFMVYMQTPEAILFPKPRKPQIVAQQNAARMARQVTIINVTQNIGTIHGGKVIGISGNITAKALDKKVRKTVQKRKIKIQKQYDSNKT